MEHVQIRFGLLWRKLRTMDEKYCSECAERAACRPCYLGVCSRHMNPREYVAAQEDAAIKANKECERLREVLRRQQRNHEYHHTDGVVYCINRHYNEGWHSPGELSENIKINKDCTILACRHCQNWKDIYNALNNEREI